MEFFLFIGIVAFLVLLIVKQKKARQHRLINQQSVHPSKQPPSIRRPIKI
jgi:hypothetical protein